MLTAVTERLMDVDEKVRSSAIAAICDAAVKNLQVQPLATSSFQSLCEVLIPHTVLIAADEAAILTSDTASRGLSPQTCRPDTAFQQVKRGSGLTCKALTSLCVLKVW